MEQGTVQKYITGFNITSRKFQSE